MAWVLQSSDKGIPRFTDGGHLLSPCRPSLCIETKEAPNVLQVGGRLKNRQVDVRLGQA